MAEQSKYLPKPYARRRYYIIADVQVHNTAFDCWVSFFNQVYDLTKLLYQHKGNSYLGDPLCQPIIKAAGTDITHWFEQATKDPKTFIDPVSNLETVYCPWGRYLHVPPIDPSAAFDTSFSIPWWKDKDQYCIGNLTKKGRKIRLINMLSKQDDILEVASEETMDEILDRYLPLNEHAASYTWKRLGRPLDMESTLQQNGIEDETEEFKTLDIDPEFYIPAIHLYYNDDLTVK